MSLKVAVDFDGTIVKLKPRFTHDLDYEMLDNAKNVLQRLSKQDITFILSTSRYGIRRILAFLYIWHYDLPIKITWFNIKPNADVYIDDKNIFCKEIDWLKIEKELLHMVKTKKEGGNHVYSNKKN